MKHFVLFIFLLSNLSAYSQLSLQVSGTVKDERNEPIIGAQVFISGSQKFGLTNERGEFSLSHLTSGNYELVVNYLGFYPESKKIVLDNQSIQTNILLKQKNIELNEVNINVVPDPMRKWSLYTFKDNFIGRSVNAAQCEILNPEILKLSYNYESRVLEANTDDYLIIENQGLGYRIKYLLSKFELDYPNDLTYYEGFAYFEELKGTISEEKQWQKNRQIAYNGSLMHFMRSAYNLSTLEEGFLVNTLLKTPNPKRPPDSLINAKINAIRGKMQNRSSVSAIVKDSLNYWVSKKNLASDLFVWNKDTVKMDTLITQINQNFKSLKFNDQLVIIYTKEIEPLEFINNGRSDHAFSKDGQTSLMTLKMDQAIIDKQGQIRETQSIKTDDYWSWERIAEMLPMDYISDPSLVTNFNL